MKNKYNTPAAELRQVKEGNVSGHFFYGRRPGAAVLKPLQVTIRVMLFFNAAATILMSCIFMVCTAKLPQTHCYTYTTVACVAL
jgi:hypothetical protein